MSRVLFVAAALCALTACYDFTGESGRLGFSSDATLDGLHPWTPDRALAVGAEPTLAVTELIATGETPDRSTLSTSRSIRALPDDEGWVISGDDGWIGAEADGVRDDLHVRRAKPRTAVFLDPGSMEPLPIDEAAVLVGQPTWIAFSLLDRTGAPLGWVAEQLDVGVHGALTASTERSLEITAHTSGPAELNVRWPNGPSAHLQVSAIDADAIDRIEVLEVDRAEGCAAVARAWADELPVLGVDAFTWEHTDERGAVVPCDERGPTAPPRLALENR